MASSDVDVTSQALACLGLDPIQSMTEESDRAETANTLYEDFIQNLITSHPWRFAMVKKRLGRQTAAPTNEWKFQFTLPPERIGDVWAVFDSSAVGVRPAKSFEIFSGLLFADYESVWVDIRTRKDEVEWPPYFTILAVWGLASLLAEPLTDDTSKMKVWDEKAFGTAADQGQGGQLRHCRTLNAFMQPPEPIDDFALIDARFGE